MVCLHYIACWMWNLWILWNLYHCIPCCLLPDNSSDDFFALSSRCYHVIKVKRLLFDVCILLWRWCWSVRLQWPIKCGWICGRGLGRVFTWILITTVSGMGSGMSWGLETSVWSSLKKSSSRSIWTWFYAFGCSASSFSKCLYGRTYVFNS